jgi:hypothetical protein
MSKAVDWLGLLVVVPSSCDNGRRWNFSKQHIFTIWPYNISVIYIILGTDYCTLRVRRVVEMQYWNFLRFFFTRVTMPAVIHGTRGAARNLECWSIAFQIFNPPSPTESLCASNFSLLLSFVLSHSCLYLDFLPPEVVVRHPSCVGLESCVVDHAS